MAGVFSFNNKLARRVLIYIILCSSVVSVIAVATRLYVDFTDKVAQLEQRFDNIETSYIESISTSLWDFNEALVQQQIQGIVNLPDIEFARVTTEFGNSYQVGDSAVIAEKVRNYPIVYGENEIGLLTVYASYNDIYQQLKQRGGFIVVTEIVKTFLVALCIIVVVHWLITRHIYRITNYSQRLSSETLTEELVLDGRPVQKDELDQLVDAINAMRLALKNDIVKLEEAENALIQLNGDLEIKVYQRTAELEDSNKQLQRSLDDLTLAKDQLVQSEKMASLGQLVAGVAHEVNTPLGICVTSITALKEKVDHLTHLVDSEKLTKKELTNTLSLLAEYEQIIERSLNKAVELIRGFKSVAVEQHTDPELEINLARHVYDVVNTVKTLFKRKNYQLDIKVDEDLNLVTFPSAWNQILTNFLMNSHIHGFDGREGGNIKIAFSQQEHHLVLDYQDDGKGISEEIKKHIFDPFVTTKRGQGGSGLGLNIVFNLVSSKLGGTIKCLDVEHGCAFKVIVPLAKS